MRYPKFLTEELLLITPAGYRRLVDNFEHLKSLPVPAAAAGGHAERNYDPYAEERPQMEEIDGIAIIPVYGPVGRNLDVWDKRSGCTDYNDLMQELEAAEDSESVRAILLDLDTPGGMVNGTPETADRIAAIDKPIYCYSGGLICSAGYWIASSTDGIFATRSADIGCIGVYSAFMDLSEMAKMMGIKVQVFSSGTYKGMGTPGTSLTKEQEALIQARIMEMAQMFYDHVHDNRDDIDDDDMQGQTFKAAAAADRGFIDQVVADRDEVLGIL